MSKKASKVRVYLVEDYAILRESLCARLEVEPGVEVVGEAGDAEHALTELKSLQVDVVLMDIELPGMSGIEATRRLKETGQEVSVVMLTSFQDDYVGQAIEAGASGYILKSSTSQQLLQAIMVAHQGQASLDPSLTRSMFKEMAQLRATHTESLLTDRQLKILRLVASGIRYKEIATDLFISETTVNREMRDIFNRLGVNDAAHAISEAYKKGLI